MGEMEPLIKIGLPSSPACTGTTGRSGGHVRRRRERTGTGGGEGEADQDQCREIEENWPLLAASSWASTQPASGTEAIERDPLEQQQRQLATNKVASIIMTAAARDGQSALSSSSCCCLKPRQLPKLAPVQSSTGGQDAREGGTGNRSSSSSNKSNIIIINNNNTRRRANEQHACRDASAEAAAAIDCPKRVATIASGYGGSPEETVISATGRCRLHWPEAEVAEVAMPAGQRQESKCLIRTMMTSKTKGGNKNNNNNNNNNNININRRSMSAMASFWSLTILILIAYELFMKARNYSTQLTCQRCPPDEIFIIRTCSALELLAPPNGSDIRLEMPIMNPEAPPITTEISSSSSPAIPTATTTTTTNSTPIIIIKETTSPSNNNNNEINITTTAASTTISTVVAAAADSSSGSGGPTMRSTVNNNAINKHHGHHQQQQQHNVLCNSRCNCVILEPFSLVAALAGNGSSKSSQPAAAQPDSHHQMQASPKRPPGGQASTQQTTTTTTMKSQQQQTKSPSNVNETSDFQQQQQQQLEQALIAFNEDYSLDSEQQWLPNGSGGPEDAGAVDVALVESAPGAPAAMNALVANGNDRALAPSRPAAADQSNTPATPTTTTTMEPASGLFEGRKRLASSVRAITTPGNLSQATTTGDADTLNKVETRDNSAEVAGNGDNNATMPMQPGSPGPQLVAGRKPAAGAKQAHEAQQTQPRGLLQVIQSDNNNTNEINGPSSKQAAPSDAPDVAGSGSSSSSDSRRWHLQETSGAQVTSQRQQQHNSTLARPQQPSSSEPGMTLFPLPAHLHHRHHHYQPLGPGSGRESSGPQLYAQSLYSSQAPKLSYHAHSPLMKSSPAGGQQQQQQSDLMTGQGLLTPTPAGHQHHHMRGSGYHLRQTAGAAGKQRHSLVPQQGVSIQRLVFLRTLDLSNRLNDSDNKTASTTGGLAANPVNPAQSADQQQQDWSESKQFAEKIKVILDDIGQNDIQSLVLRDNNIQFELWSELYALLVHSMRQHLYHLDMSHNSLAKLGITFTGYIEHHLAVHGNWPFNGAAQASPSSSLGSSSSTPANKTPSSGQHGNEITNTGSQQQQPGKMLKIPGGRMRGHNSLLGGGKLYTQVQRLLLSSSSSGSSSSSSNNNSSSNQNPSVATGAISLQQPLLLRALDLSHNKLKWLINDQFKALKHVQTIRLDYNRIRYINQHAFSGLESLRFLNLNFNRLQVIYIEQFQTNYNLLALMLRSNYLAYLRGGSFASLANLRRLDLSRNKLTIISNNAFVGLESLEMLNCSSNQFVHAPSASLHPLTSLRQLDLSDNLITQLAPGTFFHLPIEELWLDQNEQLVAIDRGAFWDLPYLRQLHLKWNPMLMSINSQAFVGTQNLQSISVDGCQSLDSSARQMLDNITMAATSRLLRYEQSRLNQNNSNTSDRDQPASQSNNGTQGSMTTADLSSPPLVASNYSNFRHPSSGLLASPQLLGKRILEHPAGGVIGGAIGNSSQLMKYSYCLAIVCLLVVALKLLFKFTSTSHYLEARRRRRRVYEAKQTGGHSVELDDGSQSIQSSSSNSIGGSENYPMFVQPDNHVIAPIVGATGRRMQMQIVNDSVGNQGDNREQEEDEGHEGDNNRSFAVEQQQLPAHHDGNDDNGVVRCNENNDISVISDSANCLGWPNYDVGEVVVVEGDEASVGLCCGGGNGESNASPPLPLPGSTCEDLASPEISVLQQHQDDQQQQPQRSTSTIDLIHSQLIAAGFDYGHANCDHFYQSLGPALQLADMTASFVNGMDYY